MKKIKFKLENKSKFPNIYLEHLCEFVIKKVGEEKISNFYEFTFKNRSRAWSGSGSRFYQIIRLNRNYGRKKGFWPYNIKDHRYYFAKEQHVNDRTELLLFLMGHEFGHCLYHNYIINGVKRRKADVEFHCNELGEKIVKEYRREKENLWKKIKMDLRKEHKRRTNGAKKKRMEKDYKKTSEYKLELAEKNLRTWLKKQNYANNKVKVHQKKVSHYKRMIEKKRNI